MSEEDLRIRLSPDLVELFAEVKRVPAKYEGQVTSNVEYALVLEYGSSQQAPDGMVRINKARFRRQLKKSIEDQLRGTDNPLRAIEAGVADAVMAITAILGNGDGVVTPVDTGRMKGSWTARLPNGKKLPPLQRITPEQQKAIKRRQRQGG